ncbi:MAG: universal stress protein [Haloarculaceae archaeon]
MDIELVLTPVDGSEDARRAADYAVAVASRYGADLHLLFVLDQRVAQGIQAGDVEAGAVAATHQEFLSSVRDHPESGPVDIVTSSAAGFSTSSLSRTPGSVVLDAAEELGADFLVVPRETPADDVDVTIGKAALYILQYADQPVLSV